MNIQQETLLSQFVIVLLTNGHAVSVKAASYDTPAIKFSIVLFGDRAFNNMWQHVMPYD